MTLIIVGSIIKQCQKICKSIILPVPQLFAAFEKRQSLGSHLNHAGSILKVRKKRLWQLIDHTTPGQSRS
jgi:hypothetical protein